MSYEERRSAVSCGPLERHPVTISVHHHPHSDQNPPPQPAENDLCSSSDDSSSSSSNSSSGRCRRRCRHDRRVRFGVNRVCSHPVVPTAAERAAVWYTRREIQEIRQDAKRRMRDRKLKKQQQQHQQQQQQQASSVQDDGTNDAAASLDNNNNDNDDDDDDAGSFSSRGLELWSSSRVSMELRGRKAACIHAVLKEQRKQFKATAGVRDPTRLKLVSKLRSMESKEIALELAEADRREADAVHNIITHDNNNNCHHQGPEGNNNKNYKNKNSHNKNSHTNGVSSSSSKRTRPRGGNTQELLHGLGKSSRSLVDTWISIPIEPREEEEDGQFVREKLIARSKSELGSGNLLLMARRRPPLVLSGGGVGASRSMRHLLSNKNINNNNNTKLEGLHHRKRPTRELRISCHDDAK